MKRNVMGMKKLNENGNQVELEIETRDNNGNKLTKNIKVSKEKYKNNEHIKNIKEWAKNKQIENEK